MTVQVADRPHGLHHDLEFTLRGRHIASEDLHSSKALLEGQGLPWYLKIMQTAGKRRDVIVLLIAIFKFGKGLILIAAGITAAALLHSGIEPTLHRWVNILWIGRESRLVERLIEKVASIDRKQLEFAEVGTFVYAAVFLTEGTGLFLRQRWAEYLTIVITASFIPFEIYVMLRRFSFERAIVLVINIAVVVYLVRKVRRDRKER
jgi:uncharacterized membrane protein (DUF2068 family)